ncbi:hypothetical protein V7S43_014847 [Phytophthora oleae]|uniref:Uncharacterized protein n=1 Tax=Phytophthora oleae TaxID=2107226 RepID=A0ABD3F2Q3_9STRA
MDTEDVRTVGSVALHLREMQDQRGLQNFKDLSVDIPGRHGESRREAPADVPREFGLQLSTRSDPEKALPTRDMFQPPRSTTQLGLIRLSAFACMALPLLKECEFVSMPAFSTSVTHSDDDELGLVALLDRELDEALTRTAPQPQRLNTAPGTSTGERCGLQVQRHCYGEYVQRACKEIILIFE